MIPKEECEACEKRLECLGQRFCAKLYLVTAVDYSHRFLDEPAVMIVFANSTAEALLKVTVEDSGEAEEYTWDAWPINDLRYFK